MDKSLISHQRILGKIYTVVGDEGTDIILNSLGNVKIRFGNSFLNLIKNGKISSEAISFLSKDIITEVNSKSEIISNGIYYNKDDGEFYIYLNGIIFKLNSEEDDDNSEGSDNPIDYTDEKYLSIEHKQKLSSEQIITATTNLKAIIEYLRNNISDIPDGYPVYVRETGKHYKKSKNDLIELYLNLETGGVVKGSVTIGTVPSKFQSSKLTVNSSSPLTLTNDNHSLRFEIDSKGINIVIDDNINKKIYFQNNKIGIFNEPKDDFDILGNTLVRKILTVLDRIISDGGIGSDVFIPGFTGEGYRIYKNDLGQYCAEFDNLTVRQTMRVYDLIVEQIRYIKGSMVISCGGAVITDVKIQSVSLPKLVRDNGEDLNNYNLDPSGENIFVECYIIKFDKEKFNPFTKNDLIRCQKFIYPNIKYYWVWVRYADYDSIYIETSEFDGVEPEIEDEICQFGNVVDKNRQSVIYLSATETVNPVIDVLSDVHEKNFTNCLRARLGNLNGVTYGKKELDGYGLFSDNIFLRGRLEVIGNNGDVSDVNDNIVTNSVDLSSFYKFKYFLPDGTKQLAFRNGKKKIGEIYINKNPNYLVPDMRDGTYNWDTFRPLDPTGTDEHPYNPYYLKETFNPYGEINDIYNLYEDEFTPILIYQYDGTSWNNITTWEKEVDLQLPVNNEPVKINILQDQKQICKDLNLLGSNNTLFIGENYPLTPYLDGDYYINMKCEIYKCVCTRIVDEDHPQTRISADWVKTNLASINIRSNIANQLGYESYNELIEYAQKQQTIIKGGYINTYLLNAKIVIGDVVVGDYMKSQNLDIWRGDTSNTLAWRLNKEGIFGGIEADEEGNMLSKKVFFAPDGTMYGLKNNDKNLNPWRFNADGSGSLAFDNIRWDINGKITFGDDVLGTIIDEGLITTGTIALGDGDDIRIINSGITGSMTQEGITDENDLVRFWAGGTLEEAINTVLNKTPNVPYVVTQGGKLYATNAKLEGELIVTSGADLGNQKLLLGKAEINLNDINFGKGFGMYLKGTLPSAATNIAFLGLSSTSNWQDTYSLVAADFGSFNNIITEGLSVSDNLTVNNANINNLTVNNSLSLITTSIIEFNKIKTNGLNIKGEYARIAINGKVTINADNSILIIDGASNVTLIPGNINEGHILFVVNIVDKEVQLEGDYIASPTGGRRDRSTKVGENCIKTVVYYNKKFYCSTDYKD